MACMAIACHCSTFTSFGHADWSRPARQGQGKGDASKSDLVRACGYVSTKKDGSERLNFTAFYEALLEAKGVSLGDGGGRGGKAGRKLSYVTKVQFNGNLLVGKAYTAMLGLEPGDDSRSSWGASRSGWCRWVGCRGGLISARRCRLAQHRVCSMAGPPESAGQHGPAHRGVARLD